MNNRKKRKRDGNWEFIFYMMSLSSQVGLQPQNRTASKTQGCLNEV